MPSTMLRGVVLVFVIAAGIPVGFWTLRVARADWLSEQDSLEQRAEAAAAVPTKALLWVRLAEKQQQMGVSGVGSYVHAIQDQPRNAKLWIGLGLEQELNGDYAAAEKAFREAERLSRESLPLMTLAGYYFRRNDHPHFTEYARRALDVGSTAIDPVSVFKMAWDMAGGQPSADFLPPRRRVLRQYIAWLLNSSPSNVPSREALRLAQGANEADVAVLLTACSRAADWGDFRGAVSLWNALAGQNLIPGNPIPADEGLQNAEFLRQPVKAPFDWTTPVQAGVTTARTDGGLKISLTGEQPEHCVLLSQLAIVRPGGRYRVRFDYQTSDLSQDSGLAWEVVAQNNRLVASSTLVPSPRGAASEFQVTIPSDVTAVRLELNYRRVLGTRRIEGWVKLHKVTLPISG